MPHIELQEGLPGILGPMAFRPETAKPLNELADVLLRGPSTLSPGERELIATYVSSENDCFFCQTVHGAVAAHHLGPDLASSEQLVADVKKGPEQAAVSPRLKALLAIAPGLRAPILMVSAGMRLSVDVIFQRMEDAGLIRVAADERKPLMTNMWIVSTYFAVYLGLQEGVRDLTPKHVHWGLGQVASLLRPYLSAQAKADLDEMLSEPFA